MSTQPDSPTGTTVLAGSRFTWNRGRTATFLATVVFLGVSIFLAARLTIYVDESFSMETSSYGVGEAFRRAAAIEEQPPFYFVLLTAWRAVHASLFFARLLSVLFVSGAGYFLIKTLIDHRATVSPPLLVLTLALNPFVLYAATEVRVYALAMLLSAAMLWAFSRRYLLGDSRLTTRIVYVVAAILAVYTQYFTWTLVGLLWLYPMIFGTRSQRLEESVNLAVVAIAFVPQAIVLIGQLTAPSVGGVERSVGFFRTGAEVARIFTDFALPSVTGSPSWPKWIAAPLLAAALGVAIVRIWHSRTMQAEPSRVAAFVVALGAIGLTAALWFLGHEDFFKLRYALFLFVPTVVFVVTTLRNGLSRSAAVGYLVVLLLLGGFGSYHRYGDLRKGAAWNEIGRYLEETDATGGAIYAFPPEITLPLKHYVGRTQGIYGIPIGLRSDRFNYADFAFSSVKQLETRFNETNSGSTVRLLSYPAYEFRGIDYNTEILERFVANRFNVVQRREFPGVIVRVLERR